MENGTSSNNSPVIAVLVLVVVALVGWFAYKQGYLGGTADNEQDIEINLPGGGSPAPEGGY